MIDAFVSIIYIIYVSKVSIIYLYEKSLNIIPHIKVYIDVITYVTSK